MRFAVSVVPALVVTVMLFLLMQDLINSERSPTAALVEGRIPPFVRLKEVEQIPFEPPDFPPSRDRIPPGPSVLPPPPEFTTFPHCRYYYRPPMPFIEEEYWAVAKVDPIYPWRALLRGVEGHVVLEFAVTVAGTVRDVVIIEAAPPGVFERAAIDAAMRFTYRPRMINGKPVEVESVRNLIKFQLAEG